MNAAIFLPTELVESAPLAVRDWLAGLIGISVSEPPPYDPARLTDEQVAKLFEGLKSEKTRQVLAAIAQVEPGPGSWAALMKNIGSNSDGKGLQGIWAGLTKRTRSITGVPNARLVGFPRWEHLKHEDRIVELDPITRDAVRRYLSIE